MQGAEVSPDVDVTKNKFAINVAFPSSSADDAIRLILEDVSHAPYVCAIVDSASAVIDNHLVVVVVVVICALYNVIVVDFCVFPLLLIILYMLWLLSTVLYEFDVIIVECFVFHGVDWRLFTCCSHAVHMLFTCCLHRLKISVRGWLVSGWCHRENPSLELVMTQN